MPKVRTATQLQAALDNELGWRISEISNFKSAIAHSESLRQIVLLRASVLMSYAHWEGFVKRAATLYGSYLSEIGARYSDLKPCFVGLAAMDMVASLGEIKRKLATSSRLAGSIRNLYNEPVLIKLWPILENIGNLDFDLFEEISTFLDIDVKSYASKRNFINERLVSFRNRIAHGERLEIDKAGADGLFDEVIGLLRSFKTDIENSVVSRSYLIEHPG